MAKISITAREIYYLDKQTLKNVVIKVKFNRFTFLQFQQCVLVLHICATPEPSDFEDFFFN